MRHMASIDHQRVRIPKQQHWQLMAIAERRGHIVSALLWCALRNAVRDALAGRPVPSILTVTPILPALAKEVRWTQHRSEYDRWARILRNANSSPAAVIRAEVTAYIESGGDVVDIGEPFEDLMYA